MIPEQMTIWHNPRCSKSRAALGLLHDRGLQPAVRLYLKEPPSEEEIIGVRNALGVTAEGMMRRGDKLYKELGLATATEAAQITAMAAHPILIERPILIHQGRAVIGRPPEDVLGLV